VRRKAIRQIRNNAEEIFKKMPPPKRIVEPSTLNTVSGASKSYSLRKTATFSSSPTVSMIGYMDSSGACFHEESMVKLSNGTHKKIMHLEKGDELEAPDGRTSKVLCLVKTIMDGMTTEFVEINRGLWITTYHPIRLNNVWKFPHEVAPVI